MKLMLRQLALAGLFVLSAGSARAAVTVSYNHPENFSDLPFASWDRTEALDELTRHFNKLGTMLPPGQELKIDVLDVDLAGREYPGRRSGRDIRILRGEADWPRILLHYSLEENGNVIKGGDAQLSDMMYMTRINRYADGGQLRYEKQMINDWWEKNIGPTRSPRK
jgi:hypothetical protein